jgi:hypothetical protein
MVEVIFVGASSEDEWEASAASPDNPNHQRDAARSWVR